MFGTHSVLNSLAAFQPADSVAHRDQALLRWGKVAGFYRQEIVNLRTGLETGYTMPVAVVERVIGTVKALIKIPVASSPLMRPADRSDEPTFKAAFGAIVSDDIMPAMPEWLTFLETEYLPGTRTERAITAIPDGRACYEAMYRSYTSLSWSPEKVYSTGAKVVDGQTQDVVELGKAL